jgi:hypothetical protein
MTIFFKAHFFSCVLYCEDVFFEAQNIFVTCAQNLGFEPTSKFLEGVQMSDVM